MAHSGFNDQTIRRVLDHLERRKLVDDRRATEVFVELRSGKRALGPEGLRAELAQRGAPEDLVEERIAAISPEERFGSMMQVLEGRCKRTDKRAKGGRLLLSRGFAEDEIESALDEFFGPADSEQ